MVLPVPESYVYLNSAILCDVQDADATSITCLTRPHRPSVKGHLGGLEPTEPGQVMVAQCRESPKDDVSKLACWAQSKEYSALASCDTGKACNWAYTVDATPVLQTVLVNSVQTDSISFQDKLTLIGQGLFKC